MGVPGDHFVESITRNAHSVRARGGGRSRERPTLGRVTGDPHADGDSDAGLVAEVLGATHAPHPEVLARVLAGLRDLPDVPATPSVRAEAAGAHDVGTPCAVPLPRRRS